MSVENVKSLSSTILPFVVANGTLLAVSESILNPLLIVTGDENDVWSASITNGELPPMADAWTLPNEPVAELLMLPLAVTCVNTPRFAEEPPINVPSIVPPSISGVLISGLVRVLFVNVSVAEMVDSLTSLPVIPPSQ